MMYDGKFLEGFIFIIFRVNFINANLNPTKYILSLGSNVNCMFEIAKIVEMKNDYMCISYHPISKKKKKKKKKQ